MARKDVEDREMYVVKANDLIRKTRFNLTAQQQKILLYAISKIKPRVDDINTQYIFEIKDFAAACGLNIDDGGFYYESLKKDLNDMTKPFWIRTVDNDGRLVDKMMSWVANNVEMWPGDGTIKIMFNTNMQPYLFNLLNNYTQYQLHNVLTFRGKYALRLYEIMRSYITQGEIDSHKEKEIDIALEDLKYKLDCESYDSWSNFEIRVLRPAIKEINKHAEDIHIEYYPMRGEHGRAIRKINFVITAAGNAQRAEAKAEKRKQYIMRDRRSPEEKQKRKAGGAKK